MYVCMCMSRYDILVIDKMKIRADLVFDKDNRRHHGLCLLWQGSPGAQVVNNSTAMQAEIC